MTQLQPKQDAGIFLTPVEGEAAHATDAQVAMAMHAQARAYVRRHLEQQASVEVGAEGKSAEQDMLGSFLKYLGY